MTIMITRSRNLLVYLIVIHSMMLVTLLSLLGVTWWSPFVLILLLISFIYYAQYHQWLKAKKSLVRVEYHDDTGWSLQYSDTSQKSGLRLTSSFVTPQLVILYFNRRYCLPGKTVTIINDAIDAESFRQLRVYLKTPKTFQ